jgi:hypothetical protein
VAAEAWKRGIKLSKRINEASLRAIMRLRKLAKQGKLRRPTFIGTGCLIADERIFVEERIEGNRNL